MKATGRLPSLDALRGFAVAGMVLVNWTGSDEVFAPLRHSTWHGFTPADLVFPLFLVALGASAALSFGRRLERGEPPRRLRRRLLLRCAGLFSLGLLVNLFETAPGQALRWSGVLQRIALCDLACGFLALAGGPVLWARTAFFTLLGYGALLLLGSAPGCPPGESTPLCSVPTWVDRALLGAHQWGAVEPEGVLSTLPAAATALLGLIAGEALRRGAGPRVPLAAGAVLALSGLAAAPLLPLNKILWTPSFALLTGGLSLLLLGLFQASPALPRPLLALGRRALAAYVLFGGVYGVLEFAGLKEVLNAPLARLLGPRGGSLAFSLLLLAAGAAAATRSAAPRWETAARPFAPARSRIRSLFRRRTRKPAGPTAA